MVRRIQFTATVAQGDFVVHDRTHRVGPADGKVDWHAAPRARQALGEAGPAGVTVAPAVPTQTARHDSTSTWDAPVVADTGGRLVYCRFGDQLVARTTELAGGVVLIDWDAGGKLVGVELLGVHVLAIDGYNVIGSGPGRRGEHGGCSMCGARERETETEAEDQNGAAYGLDQAEILAPDSSTAIRCQIDQARQR